MRSAISHISFIFELVIPILAACPVVIARAGRDRESRYLIRLIRQYRVTRLFLTPTLLRELMNESNFAACTSLERVGASGEPLPPALQERFFSLSNAALFTTYGCTEFPTAVRWQCHPDDIKEWYVLGVPTPGTTFYLLNENRTHVPAGEVGEIYVGGSRLADGYWGRPDLTAERFIPNPFGIQEAPLLYRTGDLARYHEDSTLEYIGRVAEHASDRQLNGQVQIRGFRVELGEIETLLDRHPLVELCAVIAVADPNWENGKKIVAYYSSADGRPVTVNELRDRLAENLPDYMLPAAFVRIDEFPLTPSGKIDRAALPEPGTSRPQQDELYVAPQGLVEEQLAEIWQEVLGIDEVGAHDNFFALGGQSLAAVRVVNRLGQLFDADLPLDLLFDHPTIAGMAHAVAEILIE
jgi:acyl-coenzyme A synthetase/AMP-(fatty) acid ligase/acyl carrier protein